MSGESNDCLWVCNVKMKKKFTRAEMGHISKNFQVTTCSFKRSELFFFENVEIRCKRIPRPQNE